MYFHKFIMHVCLFLNVFTFFSSLHFAAGNVIRRDEVIEEVNANIKDAADGAEIIKQIADGKSISEKPGIIMFTAPYKLCEGGCNGSDGGNIMLQFPLFVGKRGRDAYKRIFHRDSKNLYSAGQGGPFKVQTNMVEATTPCVVVQVNFITTTTASTTATEPPTTTTLPAPQCPFFPDDVCLKKKKQKTKTKIIYNITGNLSSTGLNETQKSTSEIAKEFALRDKNADMSYLHLISTEYNFYDLGYPYLSDEQQQPA